RAAGGDDDRRRVGGRVLPRRADPEPPDANAVVELAPCVLPPVANVLRLDHVEADGRLVRVHGIRAVELLHAVGEEVQQEEQLRLAPDDHVPLQRNALFSFPKKPSSGLYVRSSACASNSSRSRRCSSVTCRGTTTPTSTRWSPRPKPWRTGIPLPRRTTTAPGCVPGSTSSCSSPSSVG